MFDLICGLGQGGSRLGREFATAFKVPAVYMNLSSVDFSKFDAPRNSMLVIGNGGTGRNPILGEQIVRNNFGQVKEFLSDTYSWTHHILITVGGGGGSGSGFMFPLIDYLLKRKKDILLIYTMPEKREGVPTKPNALIILDKVINKYMHADLNNKISLILIDNNYCIQKYGTSGFSYWEKVNKSIVNSLKRFWLLTNLEKYKNYIDVSSGYKALDENDLKRILYSKSGYTDIVQVSFNELNELENTIDDSSLIFRGHVLSTASKYIVSLGLPDSWKNKDNILRLIETVFNKVGRLTKHAPDVLRCSYFNKKITKAYVNIMFTGITKSKGVNRFIKETSKDVEISNSVKEIEKLNLQKIKLRGIY